MNVVLKIDTKAFIDKLEDMRNELQELGVKYPFLNISWDDEKVKEYLMKDIKVEYGVKE